MILDLQHWEKIAKELQKTIKMKNSKNNIMCQNKWNSLNFDFKKLANYHKGMGNHTCFQDLTYEKKEYFHLPRQYTQEYYKLIEVFQGEKNINIPLHTRDVNVKGDNIYKPPR